MLLVGRQASTWGYWCRTASKSNPEVTVPGYTGTWCGLWHKLWSSRGYCSLHNELSNNRGLCKLRWEAAIFYPAICNKVQGRYLLQNFHRRLAHLFALFHCSSVPLSGLSIARLSDASSRLPEHSLWHLLRTSVWQGRKHLQLSSEPPRHAADSLLCLCNSFAEDVTANTGTVIYLRSIFHLNVLQTFVYCN